MMNFSMEHPGHCYKNSNLNPASAEETQAVIAARKLLLDDDGNYLGDDRAIFGSFINSDNDTRAPNAFIKEQNRIIGEAADGKADHSPDIGHNNRCQNNAMHKLMEKDKSFKGKLGLNNLRISSMTSDTSQILKELARNYEIYGPGHKPSINACQEQLGALVYHHCGIHDKCKHERWCTFLKVKNEHPEWSEDRIAAQAAEETNRPHEGKDMSLDEDGMKALTAEIMARYSEESLEKLALGGCSNLSENFWGMNTKFSEGKRLNQDHSDLWEIINYLSFCRKGDGNIDNTHDEVSEKLSLPITSPELRHQKIFGKKRKYDQHRQATEDYHRTRTLAKISKAYKMGKLEAKKCHKSGKVPLGESAKSSVGDAKVEKAKAPRCCGSCNQPGHTVVRCKMPQAPKAQPTGLFDWDIDALSLADELNIQPKKAKLNLLAAEDWV